jgi:hypothetical protein
VSTPTARERALNACLRYIGEADPGEDVPSVPPSALMACIITEIEAAEAAARERRAVETPSSTI